MITNYVNLKMGSGGKAITTLILDKLRPENIPNLEGIICFKLSSIL